MGLLDAFKPKWKRSAEWAMETLRASADVGLILRVMAEAPFPGRDAERVRACAVDRLGQIGGDPAATQALERLAREGTSPVTRCHAAYALRDRPGMAKLVAENVVRAYGDPNHGVPKSAPRWIECVGDADTVVRACHAVSGDRTFRREMLKHVRVPGALSALVPLAKDDQLAWELFDALEGTQQEYGQIIRDPRTTEKNAGRAIERLSADNPLLEELALQKEDPTAVRRLLAVGSAEQRAALAERGNEAAIGCLDGDSPLLEKLALEKGNPAAIRRLALVGDEAHLPALADLGSEAAVHRMAKLGDVSLLSATAAKGNDTAIDLLLQRPDGEEQLVALADGGSIPAAIKLTQISFSRYFKRYDPLLKMDRWEKARQAIGTSVGSDDRLHRDCNGAARDAIKALEDPGMILRIALETQFSGRGAERVRVMAADRLLELGNIPGAKDGLRQLAGKGASPLIRCHAAYLLRSEPGMGKIIEKNIAQAYRSQSRDLVRKPQLWIECVGDAGAAARAYGAAAEDAAFQEELLHYIKAPGAAAALVPEARDSAAANHILDVLPCTREDRERIIRDGRTPGDVRDRLVGELGLEDALLGELAEQGHPAATRHLEVLQSERRLGLELRQRARQTGDGALMAQAIAKGAFSEEELEQIAMSEPLRGDDCPAMAAIRQLRDPDRLARLLLKRWPGAGETKAWNEWGMALIDALRDREDALQKCVLETDYYIKTREAALSHIHTPEKLLPVAMGNGSLALKAARKLPDEWMGRLRRSESAEVAAYALERFRKCGVQQAPEEELPELMEWYIGDGDDAGSFLEAVQRAERQQTLLAALGTYLRSNKRSREKWKTIGPRLLERITDGAGLASVCLDSTWYVHAEEAARLRALIGGTDEEKRFTEAAKARMFSDPERCKGPAGLLKQYYGLPSAEWAIWRFGGTDFIREVLYEVGKEKEYGAAWRKARIVSDIYRNVPESRPAMEFVRSRKFSVHADVRSNCASEDEDYTTSFTVPLEDR